MNQELLEKLKAIREDLVAFQVLAQVGDAKKLAELVMQSSIGDNYYSGIVSCMTPDQMMTLGRRLPPIIARAERYLRTGECPLLIGTVENGVPELLADLDDIAEKLKAGEKSTHDTGLI